MPLTLSGLVIARNEGHQLGGCLASLRGLPVTVIDHGSADDTAAQARRAGAEVFTANGTLSELRALGTHLAKSTWLISLDADERLPPGALDRIRAALVACPPGIGAFRLSIRTFLGQKPLRWGGYCPQRIRLYRPTAVFWPTSTVHERPEVVGEVATLPITLDHHCYRDLDHVREKTRRYAAWAALDLQTRGRTLGVASTWSRAAWRWVRVGLLQGGLLMGHIGWQLTTLQAAGVLWRGRWSRHGVPAMAAAPPGPDLRPRIAI